MIIFAYSFPHKKTQDFLLISQFWGFEIEAVIAAKPQVLKKPKRTFQYKYSHASLFDIPELCARGNIRYFEVSSHNGLEAHEIIQKIQPKLGLISGARILKDKTISLFSKGIINIHPGLIPEVRGMDSLLWALYLGLPLGVTAHFIDSRVDAGRVIQKAGIEIHPSDSLKDIYLRLYETQIGILPQVLLETHQKDFKEFEPVPFSEKKAFSYFPEEKFQVLLDRFEKRKMEGR